MNAYYVWVHATSIMWGIEKLNRYETYTKIYGMYVHRQRMLDSST